MSKSLNRWLLGVIASLLMVQPAVAVGDGKGRLVGVPWLEQNLKRDDVLLLDASPGQLHAKGHIPGAVNVDVFTFGGREMSPAEMERLIRSWGVSAGRKIVIYDQGGRADDEFAADHLESRRGRGEGGADDQAHQRRDEVDELRKAGSRCARGADVAQIVE